jgi:hypothetical protein
MRQAKETKYMREVNEEFQEVMEELNTDLALTEDRPLTEKKNL